MMADAAQNLNSADDLSALKAELLAAVTAARDTSALDEVRVTALGKKGRITEMMKTLGALAPDARKERGAALNVIKDEVAQGIEARQKELATVELTARLEKERVDVTLAPRPQAEGRVHPSWVTTHLPGRAALVEVGRKPGGEEAVNAIR